MDYPYSAVLILPSEYKDDGDAFSELMGWGPNCYSVALSETGHHPATHYGCRAQVQQSFIDMFDDPPMEAVELINVLIPVDGRFLETDDGYTHFATVISEIGLKVIDDVAL